MTTQEINEYFGKKMRFYMKKRGLHPGDLAHLLDMSTASLYLMIRGKGGTTLKNLWIIASALGCKVSDLLPKTITPSYIQHEFEINIPARQRKVKRTLISLD